MELSKEIDVEIKNFEVDFKYNFKIYSLLNYFQHLASSHADELNFGYENLEKNNLIWILHSIEIKIFSIPKFNDFIKISTITKGLTNIYAIRCYEVYHKNIKIIDAVSYWLLVDKTSHRPVRPQYQNFIDKNIFFDNEIIKSPKKIKISDSKILKYTYSFKYLDIDINQHVNNTEYAKLVLNCFDDNFFSNYEMTDFQIIFTKEAKLNDIIDVYIEELSQNEFIVQGINNESKIQNFCGKVKANKK